MVVDCSTEIVPVDGHGYWIDRTHGEVQAYAQALIRGTCRLDKEKPVRPIEQAGLPTSSLQALYEHLKSGGNVLAFYQKGRKQADLPPIPAWWEKSPPAEVAGKGGQEMMD